MSEVLHLTTNITEHNRFMNLLCIALLFKLAGQQTVSVQDLSNYSAEFDGIKIHHDDSHEDLAENKVTVTLHRRA